MRGGHAGFKAALAGPISAVESGDGKSNSIHDAQCARRYFVAGCMVRWRWRGEQTVYATWQLRGSIGIRFSFDRPAGRGRWRDLRAYDAWTRLRIRELCGTDVLVACVV